MTFVDADKFPDLVDLDEPSIEEGIALFVMFAEQSYARMYESSHPKDDRDEALFQLSLALRIARRLKLADKEAEISEHYAQIEEVFNSQFRRSI